jgi:hypothetical protein
MKLTHLMIGIAVGITIGFSTNAVAQNFSDVNTSDWFYDYVQKIQEWGIISGNDDGTFAPGRDVVRAELGKMFVLFDERTDEKILNSEANIRLSLNESLQAVAVEPVKAETLPTTMVLRIRNNPAPLCPTDWTEVDSGYVGSDDLRLNRRTCLTQNRCEVLALKKHKNNPPAN